MIRPFRAETERYGDYSKPGESVYDHPFQWGSRRIGPDLARVGEKYPHLWHVRHMEDPRSTVRTSIMPAYPWLNTKPLDLSESSAKLQLMTKLNVPYSPSEIFHAEASARDQAAAIAKELQAQGREDLSDKQIIALVAYLQRLGIDIHKVPEHHVPLVAKQP
jgi:cytochrome c oxidase cbb3-type subunit I/II